jgi:Mut7-C ubiquitin
MVTKRAEFRFYAELNDFLPRKDRFATLSRRFNGEVSVKDMIEAAGVPHTEVEASTLRTIVTPVTHIWRQPRRPRVGSS